MNASIQTFSLPQNKDGVKIEYRLYWKETSSVIKRPVADYKNLDIFPRLVNNLDGAEYRGHWSQGADRSHGQGAAVFHEPGSQGFRDDLPLKGNL